MRTSWLGSPESSDVARSIYYYTDSATFGGAEKALFMLIEALDRSAWTPTLLLDDAPGGPPLAAHLDGLDVTVRTVRPMPLGGAGAVAVPQFVRKLRRWRPDVFHAHLSWPMAAKYALASAVLARVPATVATVQLFPPFELDRSNALQLRAIAGGIGRYIAVSRDIAGQLIERMHWPERKVEVVYNAVDLDRREVAGAAQLRAELTGGRARELVLTAARLDAQKGHSILLRAAAELPQAHFALAGDGPARASLEADAASLGIVDRVTFLGHRGDVPQLLAACDAFALPSLYEGSSLAILEAMAARRAVVSSEIGGTAELIEQGENGLLVPPGDPGALAGALRRLLADAGLREKLAGAGRDRVEREFGPERMAGRTTAIYEELLADG
jgi:glycosyltransferase involved in cell wall biosynthesis